MTEQSPSYSEAMQTIAKGNELVAEKRFHEAKSVFAHSLEICPTAEGYTFLGWMLSYEGMVDEAIDLCRQAIEVDPEYGNPYNDIGSYLIRKNKLDEAVPWLEKAKNAKRYEPRQFPYMNLARLYMMKGRVDKAVKEYEGLLQIDPENTEAKYVLSELAKVDLPEGAMMVEDIEEDLYDDDDDFDDFEDLDD